MRARVRDALVLVDVVQTFEHDGRRAAAGVVPLAPRGFVAALERARADGVPVVYANDTFGVWDGDAPRLVRSGSLARAASWWTRSRRARARRFVVKPRYSAFDHTPLELILARARVERLLLGGMSTEGCVAQTTIDARELGFKVTVLASACATRRRAVEQVALGPLETRRGRASSTALAAGTEGGDPEGDAERDSLLVRRRSSGAATRSGSS
jgi:nicotinamidase-related amidase